MTYEDAMVHEDTLYWSEIQTLSFKFSMKRGKKATCSLTLASGKRFRTTITGDFSALRAVQFGMKNLKKKKKLYESNGQ